MSRNWDLLRQELTEKIKSAPNAGQLEQLRVELLGKKGSVNALMQEMKSLASEDRKEFGMAVNNLKKTVEENIAAKMAELKENELNEKLAKDRILRHKSHSLIFDTSYTGFVADFRTKSRTVINIYELKLLLKLLIF